MPKLFPGCQEIVDIYWCARDQYRVDASGCIIGLDITAVQAVMNIFEIPIHKRRGILITISNLFWRFEPLNRKGAY